jgi:uncharacterized protein YoxC
MLEIILGIGVVAFIVYASFTIVSLVSLTRTSVTLEGFIKRTEGNINGTLVELKGTLENVRKITGEVGAVVEEVRQISHTVVSLDKGLRGLYSYLREGFGTVAEANIAGLKVGIKTGVLTLVKNLKTSKEESP